MHFLVQGHSSSVYTSSENWLSSSECRLLFCCFFIFFAEDLDLSAVSLPPTLLLCARFCLETCDSSELVVLSY